MWAQGCLAHIGVFSLHEEEKKKKRKLARKKKDALVIP